MAENAKAGKNKIGDNQRQSASKISLCSLCPLWLYSSAQSAKSVANFLVDFSSKFGIIQTAIEMAGI